MKMPNVQQKKFNKGGLVAALFLFAMIAVVFLKIDFWYKILIDVALILLFLFIRRGYIFFYRAAMAYKNGGESEKVWKNLERALKSGVDYERNVSIGSFYVQNGDAARGVQILEKVMANPKAGDFRKSATIVCSMGYWRLGEQQKAVDVLTDLRDTGYRNDNLSINLQTYLLELGDLKTAKQVINEDRKNNVENNGMLDNRGWYYIQMGFWQKAKEVFDELIDDRNAKFPEAYLHGAQVSIHYGDIEQAVDRLGWSTGKVFAETCLIKKEYVEKLMLGLENPKTRKEFAAAIENAPVEVSCGRPFAGMEKAVEFDEDGADVIKPKEKPEPVKKPAVEPKASSDEEEVEEDIDDREPNTDLDEDDDEIAAKYGLVDEPEEEEDGPNTDLDDDDREPNTELDDEDK